MPPSPDAATRTCRWPGIRKARRTRGVTRCQHHPRPSRPRTTPIASPALRVAEGHQQRSPGRDSARRVKCDSDAPRRTTPRRTQMPMIGAAADARSCRCESVLCHVRTAPVSAPSLAYTRISITATASAARASNSANVATITSFAFKSFFSAAMGINCN